MFTGIIQDIGTVASIDREGDWSVTIATHLPLDDIASGASIACSGICLTVIESGEGFFKVRISAETLGKTTAAKWNIGTRVNLERALRLGEELGGHLVGGHVDGIARVVDKKGEGDSLRFAIEVPPAYSKFIAAKGSIALDGVSLTVNKVLDARFGVNVIPHTRENTTIGKRNIGDEMNFEVDMIARYVERMLHHDRNG